MGCPPEPLTAAKVRNAAITPHMAMNRYKNLRGEEIYGNRYTLSEPLIFQEFF
jgi:hypothetical protein